MRIRLALPAVVALVAASCEQPAVPEAVDGPVAPVAFQQVTGSPDFQAPAQHMILTKRNTTDEVAESVVEAGGTILFQHDLGFVFASGLTSDAADALAADGNVVEIAEDEWFAGDETFASTPDGGSVLSPDNPAASFFFARQWHMRTVNAEAAWDAGRLGSPDVTVAILDTGIDYLYPDLQGRVDLSRSVSFVPIDDLFAEFFFPGRELVTDLHFHGTHVAATAVSNGFVGAGVTSGATLMGVKVCTFTDFSCSFGAVISGILHAVDNGADVLNLSLGGGFPKAGNGRFVGFINTIYNYARRQGATVVVAAGNAATDLDRNGNVFASYCDAPGVICVSATGPTDAAGVNGPWTDVDTPTGYTNFGSAITVAAPGGTGAGRVWAGCSQTSLLIPQCGTGSFILGLTGTSMATPHVAGLAALVVEDVGRRPSQVKNAIRRGADDLGKPGSDPFYGAGRIDVGKTLGIQ